MLCGDCRAYGKKENGCAICEERSEAYAQGVKAALEAVRARTYPQWWVANREALETQLLNNPDGGK